MNDAPARSDLSPIPYLRLPEPALLFEERSARLGALALGHAAGDYLALLARIARGQARAVREIRADAPASNAGGLPLAEAKARRTGAWRRMLAVILAEAKTLSLPPEALLAIRRLEELDVALLEAGADDVLRGELRDPDALATAPFVGAALQAFLAALAAPLDPSAVARAALGCPACGGPPLASVVHGDDRLRYVACAHCSAQWHLPRVHCTLCGGNAGLSYLGIEGEEGTKAEACERCKAYVKIFDLEKRPGAEPLADDAATLALDLLMADEGWARGGVNLLFVAAAEKGQAPGAGSAGI